MPMRFWSRSSVAVKGRTPRSEDSQVEGHIQADGSPHATSCVPAGRSVPRASGPLVLRVHRLTGAASFQGSDLHPMQIPASFEPPKFCGGGRVRQWSRSRSGARPRNAGDRSKIFDLRDGLSSPWTVLLLCSPAHLYAAPQYVGQIFDARAAPSSDFGPVGAGLCTILEADFWEFTSQEGG